MKLALLILVVVFLWAMSTTLIINTFELALVRFYIPSPDWLVDSFAMGVNIVIGIPCALFIFAAKLELQP